MKLHYLAHTLLATKQVLGLDTSGTSRRLELNQAEAAKRVDNIINQAMSLVDKGDVTGTVFPLNYVKQSLGNQVLSVNLRLPGVDRNLNVVVDTGSSSLAFCNKSLAEEATNINKIKYALCIEYGEDVDTFTCPDESIGHWNFIVGQIYQGDVDVYNNKGDEITTMDNVSFAITDKHQNNACFSPLDGILGVSYTQGNTVYALQSDSDALSVWNESSCTNPNPNPKGDSLPNGEGGSCLGNTTTLPSPLQQTLEQSVATGYNKAEVFGMYFDYAATTGAAKGTVIPSLGIYFSGDLALNNQFYNSGKAQVAKTLDCGPGVKDNSHNYYDYMLIFNSIRVPSQNVTQSTTDLCTQACDKCITDSGANGIDLPLPKEFCNSLKTDDDEGSMYLDLESSDGGITLSLPLPFLREQLALGYFICSGTSGSFILGPPIFQYYYQVFDMGSKTVTFVDLVQPSNETAISEPAGGTAISTTDNTGHRLYLIFTTGIVVLVSCINLWK